MKPSDLQCYALDVELRHLPSIIQNKPIILEHMKTDRHSRNFSKTYQEHKCRSLGTQQQTQAYLRSYNFMNAVDLCPYNKITASNEITRQIFGSQRPMILPLRKIRPYIDQVLHYLQESIICMNIFLYIYTFYIYTHTLKKKIPLLVYVLVIYSSIGWYTIVNSLARIHGERT